LSNRLTGSPHTPRYPSQKRLVEGLAAIFSTKKPPEENLTILARKPNPLGSTFPTEIVKCRLARDRTTLGLFVKYGTRNFDGVHGHRGNVSYESKVYQEVLRPLRASTPSFYGAYQDKVGKIPWLVLEYLPGGTPASWSKDPRAMIRSARWIGRFHAASEKLLPSPRLRFLHRYDANYYKGWSRRTKQQFSRFHGLSWIPDLCDQFEKQIPRLLASPQTIIHGEYFGSNIIYQNSTSHPADWQSAAVAPGEIDLASLTHSWPTRIVQRCEREYCKSRWPSDAPNSFEETLEVARLYMNLRWLGDRSLMAPLLRGQERPIPSKNLKKFIRGLYEAGDRMGLVKDDFAHVILE
jgi:hypothetical protein